MTTLASLSSSAASITDLQVGFLAALPEIESHGRVFFRHLRCRHQRDEAIAEMVALAWKWFQRLAHRGKNACEFTTTLAWFAAYAVANGRRLCGQEKAKDVMSAVAQRRGNFAVERLPDASTLSGNPLSEALQDNTQTPVPEQVSFRCDFPAWRRTRSYRDRRIMDQLMVGERTADVADRFGLSPARVAQLRRDFHDDWEQFSGDGAGYQQPIHGVA